MTSPSRLLLCALSASLSLACSRPSPDPTPAATSVAITRAPVSASAVAPVASASARQPVARRKAEAGIKRDAFLGYQKSLAEGRKLAQAKKWTEAIEQFNAALKQKPDDPRALADLGYALYHAGDLDKARTTNLRALRAATDPSLRASVLFNEGMVDEKKSDKDAARKHYEASLALRPNATVQARLDALGPAGGCDVRFASRKELEACLTTREAPDLMFSDATAPVVFEDKGASPAGLKVVRWGRKDGNESPYMIVGEGAWGARRLATVGSDYEPGAFGVHNEAAFERFETRKVGSREVVLVWTRQSNYDSNMAGAQADTQEIKQLTVCVPGDATHEPRCPVSIPLEEKSASIYPLEIEKNDELYDTIEEMKKNSPPGETVETATFSIDDDGTFRVKETRGKRAHLAPYVRGVKLF